MVELIGPRGLGDAIFVRMVAAEWLRRGERVAVFTRWREVYADMNVLLKEPESRTGAEDNLYHCIACAHCQLPEVKPRSFFTRICHQSGLFDPVPMELNWKVRNPTLLGKIKKSAAGRPILLYQPPKLANGHEQSLFCPSESDFISYLNTKADHFRVKVGSSTYASRMEGAPCECDLFDKTSVSDVFDLATIADLTFSQVCYLGTLSESLNRKTACMFTKRAMQAGSPKVRFLRPENYFHKQHLVEAVYVA